MSSVSKKGNIFFWAAIVLSFGLSIIVGNYQPLDSKIDESESVQAFDGAKVQSIEILDGAALMVFYNDLNDKNQVQLIQDKNYGDAAITANLVDGVLQLKGPEGQLVNGRLELPPSVAVIKYANNSEDSLNITSKAKLIPRLQITATNQQYIALNDMKAGELQINFTDLNSEQKALRAYDPLRTLSLNGNASIQNLMVKNMKGGGIDINPNVQIAAAILEVTPTVYLAAQAEFIQRSKILYLKP